jgi:Trypsin-co-occurring domain 1
VQGSADKVVKADLGDGRILYVEARTAGDTETQVSVRDLLSFDGVTDSIEAIAQRVTAALASVKPNKATAEFGLDIGIESSGLTGLLAKGTGTATLKITLEWEATADRSTPG